MSKRPKSKETVTDSSDESEQEEASDDYPNMSDESDQTIVAFARLQ